PTSPRRRRRAPPAAPARRAPRVEASESSPRPLGALSRPLMPDKRPFQLAPQQAIHAGEVADFYCSRTVQSLRARGNRTRVKAEVYLKSLPGDWSWGILAGIEEAAH